MNTTATTTHHPASADAAKINAKFKKDYYGGALMVFVGCSAAYAATGYKLGTLGRMGPGFFPTALGVLLALIGLMIAASARTDAGKPAGPVIPGHAAGIPDMRGGICIVVAILAFLFLGHYCGLVPAAFAITFISALGDRNNTLKQSALISLAMVVVAAVVFSWALHMQMPLFSWEFK